MAGSKVYVHANQLTICTLVVQFRVGSESYMMDNGCGLPPILVYYSCRGKLQIVRELLTYMQQPFHEVSLDLYPAQKATLPPPVTHALTGLKIDKTQLPLLIHEDLFIYEEYPIIAYLCRRFNREDLLGSTIQLQATVQQLVDIYFFRRSHTKAEFFRLAEYAMENTPKAIGREMRRAYEEMIEDSGFMREMSEWVERQHGQTATVLGSTTIIDFIYAENALYMLGLFKHLLRLRKEDYPILAPLHTMKHFRQRFVQLTFYQQHREYLESFKIIYSQIGAARTQGLRKIWQGDPKYVN